MKKFIFWLLLLVAGTAINQAHAARIKVGNVEKIKKVADLPNTDEYQGDYGDHIDIGAKYTVFTVMGLPVWPTESPQLVGLSTSKDLYYDIPQETMQEVLKENNLPSHDELLSKVSFWDKYLGMVVIVGIVVAYFVYQTLTSKESDKDEVLDDGTEENKN
ncbi:hypothetical protein [Ornithobacterium rhinotracheale]|uniref:hypothetical protein n=1 Tax=Ornithobacterium rhinotracheale TaxID=28251 RepID=UPI001FF41D20|nr:hypothetical protein [Ornithobacterium rhinotracheale]MCK0206096.1 hypothetical protein [Ornithobacterium rhinotracheale]